MLVNRDRDDVDDDDVVGLGGGDDNDVTCDEDHDDDDYDDGRGEDDHHDLPMTFPHAVIEVVCTMNQDRAKTHSREALAATGPGAVSVRDAFVLCNHAAPSMWAHLILPATK